MGFAQYAMSACAALHLVFSADAQVARELGRLLIFGRLQYTYLVVCPTAVAIQHTLPCIAKWNTVSEWKCHATAHHMD